MIFRLHHGSNPSACRPNGNHCSSIALTPDTIYGRHVQATRGQPTALQFLRDHVSRNVPLVVRDLQQGGDHVEAAFVKSCQERMTFPRFLQLSQSQQPHVVPYIQRQDNNLVEEFGILANDINGGVEWANEALGKPAASNLWIGNHRSVTSFHKDHYENIYAVIRGTKLFTLLPPQAVFRMDIQQYPAATYQMVDGRLEAVLDQPRQLVAWSPIDPLDTSLANKQAHPRFFDPSLPPPVKVEVHAGDILYLPNMWYHHVCQKGGAGPNAKGNDLVVAVNFWYDMDLTPLFGYHSLVQQIQKYAELKNK